MLYLDLHRLGCQGLIMPYRASECESIPIPMLRGGYAKNMLRRVVQCELSVGWGDQEGVGTAIATTGVSLSEPVVLT